MSEKNEEKILVAFLSKYKTWLKTCTNAIRHTW